MKGRILRIKKGINPNSSGLPIEVTSFGWASGVLVAVLGATGYVVYAVGQAGAI